MQARIDALALMQEALRLLDTTSGGGGIAVCTLQLAVDQLGVQVGSDGYDGQRSDTAAAI